MKITRTPWSEQANSLSFQQSECGEPPAHLRVNHARLGRRNAWRRVIPLSVSLSLAPPPSLAALVNTRTPALPNSSSLASHLGENEVEALAEAVTHACVATDQPAIRAFLKKANLKEAIDIPTSFVAEFINGEVLPKRRFLHPPPFGFLELEPGLFASLDVVSFAFRKPAKGEGAPRTTTGIARRSFFHKPSPVSSSPDAFLRFPIRSEPSPPSLPIEQEGASINHSAGIGGRLRREEDEAARDPRALPQHLMATSDPSSSNTAPDPNPSNLRPTTYDTWCGVAHGCTKKIGLKICGFLQRNNSLEDKSRLVSALKERQSSKNLLACENSEKETRFRRTETDFSNLYARDLLPAKNGEEQTVQFLLEVVDILLTYVRKTFDRSTKVLDFHHPHQLLEGMEGFNLELSDNPESLEQILVDCRDTLKYGVRTGERMPWSSVQK
ncbi:Hypothetical predicted protein [Podarcis lilfordi]|uniref:Glutamate decarboxylase 1 n=1 Tax=Podarcis lilfordi TaxID=74358 RepID=A0AA35JMB5_9SAUR|nr:Hypothetical predicted protein [Podarcis lilfordi]